MNMLLLVPMGPPRGWDPESFPLFPLFWAALDAFLGCNLFADTTYKREGIKANVSVKPRHLNSSKLTVHKYLLQICIHQSIYEKHFNIASSYNLITFMFICSG